MDAFSAKLTMGQDARRQNDMDAGDRLVSSFEEMKRAGQAYKQAYAASRAAALLAASCQAAENATDAAFLAAQEAFAAANAAKWVTEQAMLRGAHA